MASGRPKWSIKIYLIFIAFVTLPIAHGIIQELAQADGKNDGDVVASRRAGVVAGKLAKAGVEKGLEVGSKLVEKQLENWQKQTQRASEFLKKKIKIDIEPDAGWKTKDLFVPPGYQVNEEEDIGDDKSKSESTESPPYNYVNGFIGPAIMNGCYGSGYEPGDPCYAPMEATTQCRDMMEAAGFIGVGFDGREEYSPESRRMSLIQRNCAAKGSFAGEQVPDTMNVHGVYDTSATMTTFSSRSEYRKYLQQEAGVSGSFFGFYAGVKKAWGSSSNTATQTFLSVYDIDITRYEIFKDEVKPSDLSQAFLKEFMGLPKSYFSPRGPLAYQEFIQRWGTHYIKSAKFGGQLEFRKLLHAKRQQTKEQVSSKMEVEFKSLFFSAGAKHESTKGSSKTTEEKTSKTSIEVQGGSQEIASILSDMYSPTFKTEFKAWLNSIPKYPKAFKFTMSPITELLDFRAQDLFPDKFSGGCDMPGKKLKSDGNNKYYLKGKEKVYCEYKSRREIELSIKQRRRSLIRAIEVYMEEGPKSISDISIEPGYPGCESGELIITKGKKYDKLQETISEVKFNLRNAIVGNKNVIASDMSRLIKFSNGKWFTSSENGKFDLYNGFSGSGNYIINILEMPLTYDETTGTLELTSGNYKTAKKNFPTLDKTLNGAILAVIRDPNIEVVNPKPCNVEWENMNLFERTKEGKCLVFTAASAGPVYVVFAVIPSNKETWYYVELSPKRVVIYKGGKQMVSTNDKNALSIRNSRLFQTYFVCIKEAKTSTVIEYGKSSGETAIDGDVYLSWIDNKNPLQVQYYAFGNGEYALQVAHIAIIEGRASLQTKCKGTTKRQAKTPYCLRKVCHVLCDPLRGCLRENDPNSCGGCRVAKEDTSCKDGCSNPNHWPMGKEKICSEVRMTITEVPNDRNAPLLEKAGSFENDLSALTICARAKSLAADKGLGTLFNYVIQGKNAAIYLVQFGNEPLKLYLNEHAPEDNTKTAQVDSKVIRDGNWHFLCVTWDSNNGEVIYYIDKTTHTSTSLSVKKSIGSNAKVILIGRHYIDLSSEEFKKYKDHAPFAGHLMQFNMWSRVLTQKEINDMLECKPPPSQDQIIAWNEVQKPFRWGKFRGDGSIQFRKTTCPTIPKAT